MGFRLLKADEIEVKIKQVVEKGAIALLYKTVRTDMNILDEVYGPMGWQDTYREIKGNLYCTILAWDMEKKQWISKEDCGIESRGDGEGNEKKGEASDAFKRAGTRWGIGRELYTAPFIFLDVPTKPINSKYQKEGEKPKYELVDKFDRFDVKEISYTDGKISTLVITDKNNKVVFTFGKAKDGTKPTGDGPGYQEQKEQSKQPSTPPTGTDIEVCSDCHNAMTVDEKNYSQKRYGKALCRKCQKKHKPL